MKLQFKNTKRILCAGLCSALVLSTAGCGKESTNTNTKKSALDPKNPVTITVWNYYNGDQLTAFEKMVNDFNSSVGLEKGIVAVTVSQGDINTLADSLLDSIDGKAGAQDIPTLAAVYSETAYILNNKGAIAPLDDYFTKEELDTYVPGFIDEGRFTDDQKLMEFPLLKSTELFTANETDWKAFADKTGVTLDSIKTKEDLVAAAKKYFDWTDSLTPNVKDDGKALYGRDSVSNYVYIGCYQLGHELFPTKDGKTDYTLDKETFRTLWDNYYIPYINGYFANYANFSSEDCKTGKILSLTSSSSGVSFLPDTVTTEDDQSHKIDIYETSELPFANATQQGVVQQGASYCLLKSTDAAQEGAVDFLKWCSASERNLEFAIQSGYSPVTLAANSADAIKKAFTGDTSTGKGKNMLNAIVLSAELFNNTATYACKPFTGSKDMRYVIGDALENTCKADREEVVAAIEGGTSREEAVKKFSTDEYFDTWFDNLTNQVNEVVAKNQK